jgi:plasmid stabilization system protein ParE
MRVVLSRRAEADLAEITDYIAIDSQARADSFEDDLLAQSRRIGRSPLVYVARFRAARPWTAESDTGFIPANLSVVKGNSGLAKCQCPRQS